MICFFDIIDIKNQQHLDYNDRLSRSQIWLPSLWFVNLAVASTLHHAVFTQKNQVKLSSVDSLKQ